MSITIETISQGLKSIHTPHSGRSEVVALYKRNKPTENRLVHKALKSPKFTYVYPYPSINLINMEDIERSYIRTFNQFKKQLSNDKEKLFGFSENFIVSAFRSIYLKLIDVDLKNIIFNITNDSSIFFKSSHTEDSVFVEVFFDNEIPNGYELMVNIHRKNGINVSFGGSLEKVIVKLKNELVSKNIIYNVQFEQTPIDEELSATYFAEATF